MSLQARGTFWKLTQSASKRNKIILGIRAGFKKKCLTQKCIRCQIGKIHFLGKLDTIWIKINVAKVSWDFITPFSTNYLPYFFFRLVCNLCVGWKLRCCSSEEAHLTCCLVEKSFTCLWFVIGSNCTFGGA